MLNSARVTLRAIRRDDLYRLCQFNNDVVIELSGGGDPPTPQTLQRLEAEFDQDSSRGGRDGARFAIEADGLFIGQCALFNFNAVHGTCELGIAIGDHDYLGKGYGREAIRLLLDYAFRLRNVRKVSLMVNSTNARAMGAYLACGFKEEGRLRRHVWSNGEYIDLVSMGIFADEVRLQ